MNTQPDPGKPSQPPLRPSEASEPTKFDQFATAVAGLAARAWFFTLCVAIVVLWAPSFLLFRSVDTWQLIINTLTTIITFLLVALLQNTQSRDAKAIHRKLNALADGLIDLMESHNDTDSTIRCDVEELRQAVGIEHREGS